MAPRSLPFRVTAAQVTDFAKLSHDTNPLHVDPIYAAATPYGGVICHGALAALRALAVANPVLAPGTVVDATFTAPIHPDTDYALIVDGPTHAPPTDIQVRDGARTLLRLRVSDGEPAGPPGEIALAVADYDWNAAAAIALLAQADGSPSVSPIVALGFAAASFVAGMHLPGRQALVRSIQVEIPDRDTAPAVVSITVAQPSAARRARGIITIDGTISDAHGPVLRFRASALQRPIIVNQPPTGPRSDALRDRTCLVVGSSRGLGWAIAAALHHRGAMTYGLQRSADDSPDTGAVDAVQVLRGDARDEAFLAGVADELRRDHRGLDALVLTGTGTLRDLWIDTDHRSRIEEYIANEVELLLRPLAHLVPIIRPGGHLIYASSSVLGPSSSLEPLARAASWPHYAAAKAAGEAMVRVVGLEHPDLRVHILRLPALATGLTATGGLQTLLEPADLARDIADALFLDQGVLPFTIP